MDVFSVKMEGERKLLEEEGNLTIEEVGPHAEMELRRHSFADP